MEKGFDFLVFRLVHQRTKPTRTVTDKLKNLYYHLIFEVNKIFEHIYGLNLPLYISSVVACTVTKSQRSLTKKKTDTPINVKNQLKFSYLSTLN